MDVQANVSLKPYNTLGVEAFAAYYTEVSTDDEVRSAVAYAQNHRLPLLVIGGGSNLLLTGNWDGLVMRMVGRGIRILHEEADSVIVEAEAGEPWHPFVQWTLGQGLCGLENLSLIPGTVGAAPVQNIGAYGVELKDSLVAVTALDRRSGELCELSLQDCAFAYRDSRFKQEAGCWVILRVRMRLSRMPQLQLDYGPIRARLSEQGVERPTALDVSRAVCAIRQEKLPDPEQLGNAGSFFKNPMVSSEHAKRLRAQYPGLVSYTASDQVKLAAGWLIEQAGWKGFREGDAGVHRQQALVLVNYGGATGRQVLELAQRIQSDIAARFGVSLEIEPNVL